MHIREAVAKSVEDYALEVVQRGDGRFHDKATRDAVYAVLREHKDLTVTRSSIRNQQLHPEYITDYVGTVESGFGNTQYQTFWSRLYEITVTRKGV